MYLHICSESTVIRSILGSHGSNSTVSSHVLPRAVRAALLRHRHRAIWRRVKVRRARLLAEVPRGGAASAPAAAVAAAIIGVARAGRKGSERVRFYNFAKRACFRQDFDQKRRRRAWLALQSNATSPPTPTACRYGPRQPRCSHTPRSHPAHTPLARDSPSAAIPDGRDRHQLTHQLVLAGLCEFAAWTERPGNASS